MAGTPVRVNRLPEVRAAGPMLGAAARLNKPRASPGSTSGDGSPHRPTTGATPPVPARRADGDPTTSAAKRAPTAVGRAAGDGAPGTPGASSNESEAGKSVPESGTIGRRESTASALILRSNEHPSATVAERPGTAQYGFGVPAPEPAWRQRLAPRLRRRQQVVPPTSRHTDVRRGTPSGTASGVSAARGMNPPDSTTHATTTTHAGTTQNTTTLSPATLSPATPMVTAPIGAAPIAAGPSASVPTAPSPSAAAHIAVPGSVASAHTLSAGATSSVPRAVHLISAGPESSGQSAARTSLRPIPTGDRDSAETASTTATTTAMIATDQGAGFPSAAQPASAAGSAPLLRSVTEPSWTGPSTADDHPTSGQVGPRPPLSRFRLAGRLAAGVQRSSLGSLPRAMQGLPAPDPVTSAVRPGSPLRVGGVPRGSRPAVIRQFLSVPAVGEHRASASAQQTDTQPVSAGPDLPRRVARPSEPSQVAVAQPSVPVLTPTPTTSAASPPPSAGTANPMVGSQSTAATQSTAPTQAIRAARPTTPGQIVADQPSYVGVTYPSSSTVGSSFPELGSAGPGSVPGKASHPAADERSLPPTPVAPLTRHWQRGLVIHRSLADSFRSGVSFGPMTNALDPAEQMVGGALPMSSRIGLTSLAPTPQLISAGSVPAPRPAISLLGTRLTGPQAQPADTASTASARVPRDLPAIGERPTSASSTATPATQAVADAIAAHASSTYAVASAGTTHASPTRIGLTPVVSSHRPLRRQQAMMAPAAAFAGDRAFGGGTTGGGTTGSHAGWAGWAAAEHHDRVQQRDRDQRVPMVPLVSRFRLLQPAGSAAPIRRATAGSSAIRPAQVAPTVRPAGVARLGVWPTGPVRVGRPATTAPGGTHVDGTAKLTKPRPERLPASIRRQLSNARVHGATGGPVSPSPVVDGVIRRTGPEDPPTATPGIGDWLSGMFENVRQWFGGSSEEAGRQTSLTGSAGPFQDVRPATVGMLEHPTVAPPRGMPGQAATDGSSPTIGPQPPDSTASVLGALGGGGSNTGLPSSLIDLVPASIFALPSNLSPVESDSPRHFSNLTPPAAMPGWATHGPPTPLSALLRMGTMSEPGSGTESEPMVSLLTPQQWDELVDVIVERIEDRVVDELSRRGRRSSQRVF